MDISKKRSRSFWVKLAALPAAITLLMVSVLSPAMASAWYDWDGMDPVIDINGKKLSITVFWPPSLTCEIKKDIQVKVEVPKRSKARLLNESSLTANGCTVTTQTVISNQGESDDIGDRDERKGRGKDRGTADITVRLRSSAQFTVYVDVVWNGGPVQTFSGPANSKVEGSVKLN